MEVGLQFGLPLIRHSTNWQQEGKELDLGLQVSLIRPWLNGLLCCMLGDRERERVSAKWVSMQIEKLNHVARCGSEFSGKT